MSLLSTREFWEKIFEFRDGHDWYYGSDTSAEYVKKYLPISNIEFPYILHCGCGASTLIGSISKIISNYGYCIHFDIVESVIHRMKQNINYPNENFLLADGRHLPFVSSSFNIILEKGLFDSLTADSSIQNVNATTLLSEYVRLLQYEGKVIIFSIFGPNAEEKDMFGLLSHPSLSVQVVSIPIPPAEIPSQNFGFIYILSLI
mmetsp:Transcript_3333/g.3478  ORF Transcript_3333/g.3478 Transcript_3333/m.3478 type:complete len:203 (+) Transcript_3333:274-882(+)